MKIFISIILCISFLQNASAQIENDKEQIVKNKVKSSFEKHCFLNSNSSCTSIFEEYDREGNTITWDMGRLGTRYKNIYNTKNQKVLTLWIDKIDPTQIDSIRYAYDKNNQLIKDWEKEFKNTYNKKQQLIRQVHKSQNNEKNSVLETRTIDWTIFDKMESETITTEVLEASEKTKYQKLETYCKKYEYNQDHLLIEEVHYINDTIVNTIVYTYDTLHRLVEKREKDVSRIKNINRMKFGNRKDIDELITKITYNKNGSIKEKFTYFSDPCMSLDNHFLYKHFYQKNGLLERADVYENNTLAFTISYEYEYYK